MEIQELSQLRRTLHAHPEPGFLEYRTAALITSVLDELGVAYKVGGDAIDLKVVPLPPGPEEQEAWAERARNAGVDQDRVDFFRKHGTAIVAELPGSSPGPTWGLRVDIDALPIKEEDSSEHLPAAQGFRSVTPYMHACGHDGHTAIGLGLAARLAAGGFPGSLRIIFQPAEEGVRGAAPMINAGVLEGIDHMLAIHLRGVMPLGRVVGGVDNFIATTKWRTQFRGEPAHASAAPEKGRNALAAAAQATLGILGITRFATADTRVNVGTFHADGNANIIPAEASITYEVRSNVNAVLEDMNRRTQDVVHGAAQMYGVTSSSTIYGSAATSLPDADVLDALEKASVSCQGVREFIRQESTAGGSDDANTMISHVQKNGGTGAYIMVGAQNSNAPHHHHRFDFDEAALVTSVDLLETLVRQTESRAVHREQRQDLIFQLANPKRE
jgi:aminobenzoyl-glutamate utilization protein A